VSPDDLDCDGLVAGADCNDMCPTGSMTCNPDAGVCGSPTVCGLGCAKQGFCAIATCINPMACSDTCAAKPTFDEQMKCALPAGHIEIKVDMMLARPCVGAVYFSPYGHECANPRIEWTEPFNDGWQFTVGPAGTGMCRLALDTTLSSALFAGDHHMIISFDPLPGTLSRWSAVVGVIDGPQGCTTDPGGFKVVDPSLGTGYFCP
jgi:hypothetical protein